MNNLFADRMKNVHKSFIREILKVAINPSVISFAGGLPNPISFPVKELEDASFKVLEEDGTNVLQYSTTEGYLPLREYLANRYLHKGIKVNPDEILITNGSQQGLDLVAKIFLNKNDSVLLERPAYLGAIQSLSMFEPQFHTVNLLDDGVDIEALSEILKNHKPKLFYSVTNFQNPTGITYSAQKRKEIANILKNYETLWIEDDPYGELRFIGENIKSIKAFMDKNVILLGSFSKIVSPAMRLGWICASPEIMEKLIIAKQASDLHTNYFSQRIVYKYLSEHNLDDHIEKIKQLYKTQRNCMVSMMEKYFPESIKSTKPEGGMFLWVTLPEGASSIELFKLAEKEQVAFVPGNPFYINVNDSNTLRLNYTNSDSNMIEEGIKRLSKVIKKVLSS